MNDRGTVGGGEPQDAALATRIYRALRRSTSDGLLLLLGERCVDCSDKAAEILGRTADQIIGARPWEFSPATQRDGRSSDEAAKGFLERARRGESLVFDWVHTRDDGSPIDVEVGLHVVPTDDEPFIVALFRDISAQKRIEAALRLSEEKFSKAFQASPDAMIIGSLETGTVEVNDSFLRLFGYDRGEVIGRTTLEIGLWKNPKDHGRVVETIEREGRTRDLEVPLLAKSGEMLTCQVSTEQIEIEDKPFGVVIARDVTEQKRAAAERQAAFEEVARLKDALERERDYLREEVDTSLHFGEIVGESPALTRVLAQVEAVATTNASVLITGETGVGKELVTRAIHAKSRRAAGPLVKVNCSSVPRELFESEFFGHVKGAFTGAHRDRVGRFQLAHGGTLFLDEVAEIPLELQPKLLRVLQEGEFERVGEDITRQVDVRVVAATNRDLKIEAEEGRFRSDLYYRLSVFPLAVPPLRQRGQDVVALTKHFVGVVCQELGREPLALSQAQADALCAYDWPGNIRELRNVVERAVILSTGERLRLDLALPEAMPTANNHSERADVGDDKRAFMTSGELKMLERRNIVAALEHAEWKVSGAGGAAELLGLKASTLAYQMKQLGISKSS